MTPETMGLLARFVAKAREAAEAAELASEALASDATLATPEGRVRIDPELVAEVAMVASRAACIRSRSWAMFWSLTVAGSRNGRSWKLALQDAVSSAEIEALRECKCGSCPTCSAAAKIVEDARQLVKDASRG